ncbi:MAG: hypothetical protein JWM31_2300 [Solirubrobacterales bacterium]|nr:hypothetical protein [Solirubrobacterales bacterium]
MSLHRIAATAVLTLATLCASLPAAAHADEPPVPTFAPIYPVAIKPITLREGVTRTARIPVTCTFDVCDYWMGPRATGTASLAPGQGDFNPFLIRQYELHRGQTRKLPVRVQALADDRVERDETFSLMVIEDAQDAGGPWQHMESAGRVTIPGSPADPTAKLQHTPCYACGA